MNKTNVPQIVHSSIIAYVIVCILILTIVASLLFGTIRKYNPIYIIGKWLYLKLALFCCGKNPETVARVETGSQELTDLLNDIENTTGDI